MKMQATRDHGCQRPSDFAAIADPSPLTAVAPRAHFHPVNLTDTGEIAARLPVRSPQATTRSQRCFLMEAFVKSPCSDTECSHVQDFRHVNFD